MTDTVAPSLLSRLKQELLTYMAKATDAGMDIELLTWWKKYASDLPYWSSAACKVALVQPSSAAAERVFSHLNCSFHSQQDLS